MLHCTVPEARQRTSPREFIRFRLYHRIYPWGDDWDQAAMVSAMVHNTAQGVKRSKKLTDFRPKYKAKAKQSGAEIERAFMALGEKLKQNGNSGKAGSSTVGKR